MKEKRIIEKPEIKEWLNVLNAVSANSEKAKLYKKIARLVSKPKRRRVEVNLIELNRVAAKGENIIVPGKVLGIGEIKAKYNIAAVEFSSPARAKLEAAGCTILSLKDMLNKNNIKVLA